MTLRLQALIAVAAAAVAGSASPALAGLKQVTVNAVVTEITHPAGADGAQIGDSATLVARYDDINLIDITAADDAYFGGTATGLSAVSLDAPGSGFKMTFRGDTFTQSIDEGQDTGGFGIAYPLVLFHNGAFWGFDVLGVRPDGFGIAFFSEAELSLDLPPVLVGGFGCCFGFGQESFKGTMDIAGAQIQGVPEPSTWALMIGGFGLAGAALRRRRPQALA